MSAYLIEALKLVLGQAALSLIGLLSHKLALYTFTALVLSAFIPILPRTLTWMVALISNGQ